MNWNELALKTPPRCAVVDIWHKGKRKVDYVFFPALDVFRSKSTRFEINKSEVTHWMIIESPTESLNIAAVNNKKLHVFNDGLEIVIGNIESIGPNGGDSSWLRYTVTMKSGKEFKVYESRKSTECGRVCRQEPRDAMLELFRSASHD